MAQYVAIRALNRSSQLRVLNSAGVRVKVTPTTDVVIDLDLATNRRSLNRHAAIGQWIITAANATSGPAASKVALTANS